MLRQGTALTQQYQVNYSMPQREVVSCLLSPGLTVSFLYLPSDSYLMIVQTAGTKLDPTMQSAIAVS